MPDDDKPVRLTEVLLALQAQLDEAQGAGGLRVEHATVEVDVVVEGTGKGGVDFLVAQGQGGAKRGRATKLTLALAVGKAAAGPGDSVAPAGTRSGPVSPAAPAPDSRRGEQTPGAVRPPGLLDLLADTLKTVAEGAGKPTAQQWPPRSGGS